MLWFGFLAFFVSMGLSGSGRPTSRLFPLLVVPILMAIFGFFLMKKLVWDLMDEVYDCGDYLLVRNGAEEDTVPLTNIMNVSATMLINPPRITLKLVNPGKFGKEIAFSPIRRFTLNPFAKDKVSEDLISRVDQARSRRAV